MVTEARPVSVIVRCRPTPQAVIDALDPGHRGVHVDHRARTCDGTSFPSGVVAPGCADATQEGFYMRHVGPAVVSALSKRQHATIIAYGQTGSGKTHTLTGPPRKAPDNTASVKQDDVAQESGVVPRLLDDIFLWLAADSKEHRNSARASHRDQTAGNQSESVVEEAVRGASVTVSFAELYNESLRDLLDPRSADPNPNASTSSGGCLRLRLRPPCRDERTGAVGAGEFFVENLTSFGCDTVEEALKHYTSGTRRSVFRGHALNHRSSRSHTVFTVRVEFHADARSDEKHPQLYGARNMMESSFTTGQRTDHQEQLLGNGRRVVELTVVDLAGSERVAAVLPSFKAGGAAGKTEAQVSSDRALVQETVQINTSLLVLGKVVAGLAARSGVTGEARPELTEKELESGKSDPKRKDAKAHLPYRDSKLTSLLRHRLAGPGAKTMLIACIDAAAVNETKRTLTFAARAQAITATAASKASGQVPAALLAGDPKSAIIVDLQRRVAALESELSLALGALQTRDREYRALQGQLQGFSASPSGASVHRGQSRPLTPASSSTTHVMTNCTPMKGVRAMTPQLGEDGEAYLQMSPEHRRGVLLGLQHQGKKNTDLLEGRQPSPSPRKKDLARISGHSNPAVETDDGSGHTLGSDPYTADLERLRAEQTMDREAAAAAKEAAREAACAAAAATSEGEAAAAALLQSCAKLRLVLKANQDLRLAFDQLGERHVTTTEENVHLERENTRLRDRIAVLEDVVVSSPTAQSSSGLCSRCSRGAKPEASKAPVRSSWRESSARSATPRARPAPRPLSATPRRSTRALRVDSAVLSAPSTTAVRSAIASELAAVRSARSSRRRESSTPRKTNVTESQRRNAAALRPSPRGQHPRETPASLDDLDGGEWETVAAPMDSTAPLGSAASPPGSRNEASSPRKQSGKSKGSNVSQDSERRSFSAYLEPEVKASELRQRLVHLRQQQKSAHVAAVVRRSDGNRHSWRQQQRPEAQSSHALQQAFFAGPATARARTSHPDPGNAGSPRTARDGGCWTGEARPASVPVQHKPAPPSQTPTDTIRRRSSQEQRSASFRHRHSVTSSAVSGQDSQEGDAWSSDGLAPTPPASTADGAPSGRAPIIRSGLSLADLLKGVKPGA